MSKKEVNYSEYTLNPENNVLVPLKVYDGYVRLIKGLVENAEEKFEVKMAYYDRNTHKQLSATKKSKMDPAKLNADYYQNIDLAGTKKNRKLSLDKFSLFALQLQAEQGGVFRLNVDEGNAVLVEDLKNSMAPEAPKLEIDES